jgi:hypothetical protein
MCNAKPSRPRDEEELFNLRHASARNVIERIFGVLKQRFHILVNPPRIDFDKQARLPPALAALHNFIRKNNPDDIAAFSDVEDPQPRMRAEPPAAAEGQLAKGLPRESTGSREAASQRETG